MKEAKLNIDTSNGDGKSLKKELMSSPHLWGEASNDLEILAPVE